MISFSDLQENYYLRNYHPLRIQFEENHYFDDWSEKLLLLKNKAPNLVDFWRYELEQHLKNESFVITVVPSSSSENKISGIHLVAQKIAKSGQITRTDATSCLSRYRSIDKLASGGSRELTIHANSIEVINSYLIKNKNVLLVDDISTTGNSLLACKELLMKAGASKVKCVTLGKTVTYHSENDRETFAESAHEEIKMAVANACAQIDMDTAHAHEMVQEDAANAHEMVQEDAANAHAQIDMNATYAHEMVEEDAANTHAQIEMNGEYEHEQVEEDAAYAHAQIDMDAAYEHEQVEKNADNSHYSIDMATEYEYEQVEEDAAYAHAQVEVGADYTHLELKF